ncbi:ABC transporter ATP-binding protein [Sporosarcina newyorkensis]|uniref:Branched-chain amino acid transport system ATP-binding protein n=2 Tax=Sporosarcina newyorkensis TaxID=759851 RepID=A0A1T4Y099_9BACL|nr:ABC transporter ATP-binding protein [Sporosarcina newyorkensis]EGQ26891.1 branched-chain amino acid ABC superfamily ATP binding cassette transporter, ABC protein [Sporosarcina newyorkensis 2681]SKA95200.1 branched-chain amino acid transport system ATP-binding protein [Sporosarcina newyorkensis]
MNKSDMTDTAILTVKGLSKSFGGVKAVNDLTFSVQKNHIHAIIGPNGAGKSTLFNLITGIISPDDGEVRFFNNNITSLRSDRIAQHGVSRTFQNIRLFPDMTVFETVLIGTYLLTGAKLVPAILLTKSFREKEKTARKSVEEILKFVGLWDVRDEYAAQLSYGNQRRVEIARALATKPQLLLLDEPTAGMNPKETKELMNLFTAVNEEGITILIIAHDMNLVNTLSDQITVINFGEKLVEGTADVIQKHPAVIEAYMGKVEANA